MSYRRRPWITIERIHALKQRYPTLGDWRTPVGKDISRPIIEVKVSLVGNEDYEFLIAVHELVEGYLCRRAGVTDEMVTQFDKENLDSDEPGDLHYAPYHKQHRMATLIERELAEMMGIEWSDYTLGLREAEESESKEGGVEHG